jgi:putative ATP-dependent endonuclease of the OLD family
MRIRHLKIERYRGIRSLAFSPGPRTVILGPNNAGKSTVLEALDLLLHPGIGRPRPSPTEIDYFGRDPAPGFTIEAMLGELPTFFLAEVREHLEGWKADDEQLVPEPEGEGAEPIARVRVRGTEDFDLVHEFAKEESGGARFPPRLRAELGWVFDGRARDPARQLAFYQGGLLDRLFRSVDVEPAVNALREALGAGAEAVNAEANVQAVLEAVAGDLRGLGLLEAAELPQFEVGAVSVRELLQSLRLALPEDEAQIPVFRQGRGAQRLLLVAILLRLARAAERPAIGAFEEPEEALEPLRQTQVARMLTQIVDRGGQIFVVTHSPEIARAFSIDDFLLLDQRASHARVLRKELSGPVRQKYERWLDRAVVRALFARIPLLVEGPGDRAVIETFWRALAEAGEVQPAERLGLDVVNCEGAPEMPMMARLLKEAGKTVVGWAEQDVPDQLAKLREEGNCAALIIHDPAAGRQNLEQALARSTPLAALTRALDALATGRGYPWDEQRRDLVSRAEHVAQEIRQAMNGAASLDELVAALEEEDARVLIAKALAARAVTPFEMKVPGKAGSSPRRSSSLRPSRSRSLGPSANSTLGLMRAAARAPRSRWQCDRPAPRRRPRPSLRVAGAALARRCAAGYWKNLLVRQAGGHDRADPRRLRASPPRHVLKPGSCPARARGGTTAGARNPAADRGDELPPLLLARRPRLPARPRPTA